MDFVDFIIDVSIFISSMQSELMLSYVTSGLLTIHHQLLTIERHHYFGGKHALFILTINVSAVPFRNSVDSE